MRKKSFILILFISLTISLPVFGQQKSRVAVLPFGGVEVSKSEAKVITGLFETALVKTGVYNVIEQNQITEILDAQAFSLSGCTDDACAVEVGKLLSAEMIIIGELSLIGGRYIANAKIIDVALGKNVNADSVSADDVGEMADTEINLLAYKLAGLTYSGGGGVRIADSFGEIFLETNPSGAEVFVNGVRRGLSPMVIEQIPLGKTLITVKKGNMSGEKSVNLTSTDLLELSIELKVSLGRLFVKSTEKDMNVYLDGEDLGPLSTGLFKDQQTGEHRIELKGEGLYWEGSVIIEEGKTVTVEAYPSPSGILSFELPWGASIVLKDRAAKTTIRGKDEINLSEGDYKVSVSGDNYQPFETEISIKRGKTLSFKPELKFTEEYLARIEENKSLSIYNELDDMISGLEAAVKDGEGDIKAELDSARECYKNIKDSGYDFPELLYRGEIVLKDAINNRIAELNSMMEGTLTGDNGSSIGKWLAFGAGAAGLALSGVTFFMGNSEYETYKTAVTSDAALESHNKLEMYSILQIVGYSVAGAGAAAGTVLIFLDDSINMSRWEAERFALSAEKAKIDGGM